MHCVLVFYNRQGWNVHAAFSVKICLQVQYTKSKGFCVCKDELWPHSHSLNGYSLCYMSLVKIKPHYLQVTTDYFSAHSMMCHLSCLSGCMSLRISWRPILPRISIKFPKVASPNRPQSCNTEPHGSSGVFRHSLQIRISSISYSKRSATIKSSEICIATLERLKITTGKLMWAQQKKKKKKKHTHTRNIDSNSSVCLCNISYQL